MKGALAIGATLAMAALFGGTAMAQMGQGPQSPARCGQITEQIATMIEMMAHTQGDMRQMHEQMRKVQGMEPTRALMGHTMGMMGQMQMMMAQHQGMMRQLCPGGLGSQTSKQGG